MINLIKQLFKFGIVGVIAFGIDYSLLYVFTEYLNIYYFYSAILSFSISTIFNYYASMKWVFIPREDLDKKKNFIIFVLLSIVGLIINQILMYLGVEVLKLYYMITKLIATIIVMCFNFITRKIFIEKSR